MNGVPVVINCLGFLLFSPSLLVGIGRTIQIVPVLNRLVRVVGHPPHLELRLRMIMYKACSKKDRTFKTERHPA
jgi:hypothetical protein